jgi:alkylation response protein AidB-like acyl-CoA dehydrogenase
MDADSREHRQCVDLLECARGISRDVIGPRALETDKSDAIPADNVRQLASAGLLGLSTPEIYGGYGAPGSVLRTYTEILAAACGTTTFVQGQHLSACALIAGGENEELKYEVLPAFARGERICGVAFSHLRRPGSPILRAVQDGDSYVFNGSAPWFTGWGLMTETVLGGTLPDGRFLYVVTPLDAQGIEASPPLKLCAMNASGTVILTIRDLRVPAERAMKTITREQMGANDLGAILVVAPQIFGVSRAALDLLAGLAEMRRSDVIRQTLDALEAEMAAARAAVDRWLDRVDDPGYKEGALSTRAWCIAFGVRCAHAAMAATGGLANSRDNDAQRLFREAMFYTLTAQTRDVQTATLNYLAEASRSSDRMSSRAEAAVVIADIQPDA